MVQKLFSEVNWHFVALTTIFFAPVRSRQGKLTRHRNHFTTAPKIVPEIVAMTTARSTKTMVFLVPMTERITSMLGRDSARPASNSARARPLPMPAPSRPLRIGTSASVAKYMKAPAIEAKRFAQTEWELKLILFFYVACDFEEASNLLPTSRGFGLMTEATGNRPG